MQNKKRKNKIAPPTRTPKFVYVSVCCSELAEKSACVRPKDKKDAETNSLGHWRCSKCGKNCKCSRQKTQETIPVSA